MRLLPALAAVLLLLACRAAPATPSGAAARSVVRPRCVVPPTADPGLLRVVGRITPLDSAGPLPHGWDAAFLAALRQRLELPSQLAIETWEPFARLSGAPARQREPGVRALFAVVELQARPRRAPDRVEIVTSSLVPAFDGALARALADLVEDGAAALPPEVRGARPLRLTVESHFVPDTTSTVLFEMWSPIVTFDSIVAFRQDNPTPTHPRALKAKGVEGATTVRFVVDRNGRFVPASLRIVRTDHPDFADAVVATLLFTEFHPAVIGGCRVASVVEMSYRFSLR